VTKFKGSWKQSVYGRDAKNRGLTGEEFLHVAGDREDMSDELVCDNNRGRMQ